MNFSQQINLLNSQYASKPETQQCYQDLTKCFYTLLQDIEAKIRKPLPDQHKRA